MTGRTPDNEFRALASLVMAEDGLCFGIAVGLYGIRLWRLYLKRKTALARVEMTPVTSPADVTALFRNEEHNSESSGRHERRRWFKISKESASESSSSGENRDTSQTTAIKSASINIGGSEVASRGPPFIIVEGVARPVDPVGFAKFMAKEEIGPWLVSDTTLSNIYPFQLPWGGHTQRIGGSSTREVPFGLATSGVLKPGFVSVSLDGCRVPLPLELIRSTYALPNLMWNYVVQLALYRRAPVAVLTEVRVLRPNTPLSVAGEVHKLPSGKPTIKAVPWMPFFLSKMSRDDMMQWLGLEKQRLFGGALVCFAIAAGILGFSITRNWRRWMIMWKGRRRGPVGREIRNINNNADMGDEEVVGDDVDQNELCIVCLAKRRKSIFVHCGHRVCCCQCAAIIKNGPSPRCPICREDVEAVYRVFDA